MLSEAENGQRWFIHAFGIHKKYKMNNANHNKGGRPKVQVQRNYKVTIHCTLLEKSIIEGKARSSNQKTSEYSRNMAIQGKLIIKTYPKEILSITSNLSHIAANIHNISRKLNFNQILSFDEYDEIQKLPEIISSLNTYIKDTLK